ncbi:MAG: hypothetical protein VB858_20680 [Planctomycetaceae bacterium]
MKRALVLMLLCVSAVSGPLAADEPAWSEAEPAVFSLAAAGVADSFAVRPPSRRSVARAADSRKVRTEPQRRQEMQRKTQTSRANDAPADARRRVTVRRGRMDPRRETGHDSARPANPANRKGRGKQAPEHRKTARSKDSKAAATDSGGRKSRKSKRNDADRLAVDSRRNKESQQQIRNTDKVDRADAVLPNSREPELPVIVPTSVRVPSYAAVRATIPFSRAEWAADPSYRHNGTMELILGQLRDLVVYQSPPGAQQGPGLSPGSGITINNGGGYPGYYGFGGIPFGFNPGTNGAAQSRAIINSFQTHGFIGRGAPVLP